MYNQKKLKKDLFLYSITDNSFASRSSMAEAVEEAILGGATMIQFRDKISDADELFSRAVMLKKICDAHKIPLIINDDVNLAVKINSAGAHIGPNDLDPEKARDILGPDKILGVSAATTKEAIAAEKAGADYLGTGAIFPTTSKDNTRPLSFETLIAICKIVKIPVVAIGGININNLYKLSNSGICGVAVIGAIFHNENIRFSTSEFKDELIDTLYKNLDRSTALTIAGSDSSGGAGIQADIKTMLANGVYASSAITSLTAQNTTGVSEILDVPSSFLAKELDSIFTDIPPQAVKIGMVSSKDLVTTISSKLREYDAQNIVLDPVMVSTSGSRLISEQGIEKLVSELFPLATIITPNIPEAEILSKTKILDSSHMESAAKLIYNNYGCSVLCKGGHSINPGYDFLFDGNPYWFKSETINNPNTHGTGCTLSSSIAANLAKGYSLRKSISIAKNYITKALEANLDLGKGSGPLDHGFMF